MAPPPNILAANFRGTLPGGLAVDQYRLQASFNWANHRLYTNAIVLPAFDKFTVGTPNLPGSMPDYESFGTHIPQRLAERVFFPEAWMGRNLDKRAFDVSFFVEVLQGSLSPQAIKQAALNNLIFEIIDAGIIRRRRQRAPTLRRVASGRQRAPSRQLSGARIPSYIDYVSPRTPWEK